MFVIRHIESNDFYKNYLSLISELSPVLSTHYSFFNKHIQNIIDNPNHFIYVIEYDNKIIASITILFEQKIIHNFKKVCHIEDLVVKKEFRRKNIAKQLINHCILLAKNNNCYKIILNCHKSLIPFYNKLKFFNNNCQMSMYF